MNVKMTDEEIAIVDSIIKKEMFVTGIRTTRKCFHCKDYITLEKEYYNVAHYKDSFYHRICLIEVLKKKKKLTDEEIEKILFSVDSIKHTFNVIIKNNLYLWLMKEYDVVMLSNHIYTKFEQIFTGTFKNMAYPIPPEHLLDMWQRQIHVLKKMYHNPPIEGVNRINYDASVLISKYPSYLNWLSKSKIEAKQTEQYIENSSQIDFSKLATPKKENKQASIFDEEE